MSDKGTDISSTEVESAKTDATTGASDGTSTTQTFETTEDLSELQSLVPESTVTDEEFSVLRVPAQDLLNLKGRHIIAEDFEWGTPPVAPLADIVVETAGKIHSANLEDFLKYATPEQKQRGMELLSLDLPLKITSSLIEDGKYWERMCLLKKSWQAYDVWRYSNNWKSMFIHRYVQELIEKFDPNKDDISELCENIKVYSNYVRSLEIYKVLKKAEEETIVDLSSKYFDQQLDEIISRPQTAIYFNFEKVFSSFSQLLELTLFLSPRYIDSKCYHFNIADFNQLFQGLQKLDNLKKIRISNGILTNEQFSVVLKLFLPHRALTVLNLSYNFIDSETTSYVAKLLISDCPIECLILKCNKITDEGAKLIAAALSENSRLRMLDLSLNMVGHEGGSFLAKVLLSNESVTDLDVSKNKLTKECGSAFADLVRKTKYVKSIKIQENYLGEIAGNEFLEAITENHSILELDVHVCGFKYDDEGSIHQAILRNRSEVHYWTYVKNNDHPAAEFIF